MFVLGRGGRSAWFFVYAFPAAIHEVVDPHEILEGADSNEEGEDAREELGREGLWEGKRERGKKISTRRHTN